MANAAKPTSRGLRLLARFFRRFWQWLVVGALAIALGVAAYASPGLDRADVHVDEGTVYAINRNLAMVGRANTQIESLESATTVADRESSILQYEDLVVVRGEDSNTLTQYNPSRNRLESPMVLPVGADVQLTEGRLLVTSPQNGRVWFGKATDVLAMDPDKDKAQFEVGVNGVATLTSKGQIIGLDVNKSMLVRGDGEQKSTTKLPFTLDPSRVGSVELSAVGEKAVVLDRAGARIWVEGSTQVIDVSGAGNAKLLPPVDNIMGGREDVRAVYATEAGLIAVTPDGARSLSGELSGAPVQPVQVGTCLYGAFGAKFVKRCGGAGASVREIPGYDGASNDTMSLQVNRRTVALNEAKTGVVWLVDQNMARIDNWQEFVTKESNEPPPPDAPTTDDKADRNEENHPPSAQDDELTARTGRATTLDVLDNDSDPDGDVLTIQAPAEIDGASLQSVRGGTGLQITIPPENKKQSFTFSYTISDGELTDTANVTVHVADADPKKENKPPYLFELAQPMTITKGSKFTKRVLTDWRDPEGDPLILEDASMPAGSEDLVTFNPDGTINYQDIGKTDGKKKINLTISDGTDVTEGELEVNVVDEPVKPIAYADFATVQVDQTVEVRPLENDIGENLILQEVAAEDCTTCKITPDYGDQSFTFSAPEPGTYYLTYNVASTEFDTGVVRIDVVPPGSDNPPVAALDVALLPPEGTVLVDPLANDTDADGDVLVIQSFSADPSLSVKLERRHLMTVTAKSAPKGPVIIEYVVSDGRHIARGSVVVIPTKNTGSVDPIAVDDDIDVRAGSIATAPVLVNDSSPIGLDLKITRILESPLGDNVWIDRDKIRVRIPPGSQRQQSAVVYEVADSEGHTASAVLNVTSISEDSPNLPPAPREVVDRVLAGTKTRIPIRLDGIDPNGDAVTLLGLGAGPKLGRVVEVGESFITYEAFPKSQGTDTFRYQVADAHGEVAAGQIRVGVAPPGNVNQPPVAVHDKVTVRPGRPIQVPVLANDYDFEGDSIGFSAKNPVAMDDDSLSAEIVHDREISVKPIAKPGKYQGTYRVTDSRQQEGIGSFSITVDKDAPLLPPTARDDIVPFLEVTNKPIVEVDVTANDFDPDGAQKDLRVSVPDANKDDENSPHAVSATKIAVPVKERTQQVRYALTDKDNNVSYALLTVPGTEDIRPVVRDSRARQITATAGQPVHLNFDDLIQGTEGRKVKLTSTDTIAATNGSAVPATGGVEYTPSSNYRGPSAVVFEVIDVVPEGDDTAKRAFVSINVEVKANEKDGDGDANDPMTNLPPEQVSQGTLQVAPGEGEFRLSAMPLFQDPRGLDFSFKDWKEVGGDAPIEWHTESSNSVIVASAPLTAKAGTKKTLSGVVTNAVGASREFQVVLEMVASRQPLTDAATDVVDEAAAGVAVPIPVTANDTSHIKSDPSLVVTGASITSGSGEVKHDGNTVTITPAEGFVGTLTARYSVQDATKDPGRVVDGSIRLNVKDKPSQPSAPFGGVPGDGQIRFEYRSGGSNGYPIDKREVIASAPGQSPVKAECSGTTCTITGLRNNVPWTLSVVEYNKLGASKPSPTSAAYIPDAKPLAPERPHVELDDKALLVRWEKARFANENNEGSPVKQWTLNLYDSQGKRLGSKQIPGNALEYKWGGLTNGQTYTFDLTATNNAGSSPASERSQPTFPVGRPTGDVRVTATPNNDKVGGSFSVEVQPGTVSANGDPNMRIRIVPSVNNRPQHSRAEVYDFEPGKTHTITMDGFGLDKVQFHVYAENLYTTKKESGRGAWVGKNPNPVVAWRKPELNVNFARGHHRYPERVLFHLTTANFNQQEQSNAGLKYQYRVVGGDWKDLHSEGSDFYTTDPLVPGKQYTADVRAVLTNNVDNVDDFAAAASGIANLIPATAEPRAIDLDKFSEMEAYSQDSVRRKWPSNLTLEETGGWDPAGYYKQETTAGEVDKPSESEYLLKQGRNAWVMAWQGVPVEGASGDAPEGVRENRPRGQREWGKRSLYTLEANVGDVSKFSYNHKDGKLTVKVNYVTDPNSKCTVNELKGGKQGRSLGVHKAQNGKIVAENVTVPPGSGSPGAAPEYPKKVIVQCTINGRGGDEWKWTS